MTTEEPRPRLLLSMLSSSVHGCIFKVLSAKFHAVLKKRPDGVIPKPNNLNVQVGVVNLNTVGMYRDVPTGQVLTGHYALNKFFFVLFLFRFLFIVCKASSQFCLPDSSLIQSCCGMRKIRQSSHLGRQKAKTNRPQRSDTHFIPNRRDISTHKSTHTPTSDTHYCRARAGHIRASTSTDRLSTGTTRRRKRKSMATTEVQLCFPIAQLLSLIVTAAPYTIVLTLRTSLHTPSFAFGHLPPCGAPKEEGCRKPVLGVSTSSSSLRP